jgi:hypothetical protein
MYSKQRPLYALRVLMCCLRCRRRRCCSWETRDTVIEDEVNTLPHKSGSLLASKHDHAESEREKHIRT